MINNILEKEKLKYDNLHKMSGFSKNQPGYGRQLELLTNSNFEFFVDMRNSVKNGRILEIGVGAGEMTSWLITNTHDSFSIDISSYAAESLSHILGTKNVLQMSAHSLTFENDKFNIVLHLDGMEHIPKEMEEDCLKEAIRVLTPGGKAYYANACCDSWWDHKLKEIGHDSAHVNIKTPQEWIQFYQKWSEKLSYKISYYEISGETVYIILEKQWPAF